MKLSSHSSFQDHHRQHQRRRQRRMSFVWFYCCSLVLLHLFLPSLSFQLLPTAPAAPPSSRGLTYRLEMVSKSTSPIKADRKGEGAERIIEFSDFWGTKIRKDAEEDGPPCVPDLDPLYGTLPNGAYIYEADEYYDPKPTCRLSIDLSPLFQANQDPQDIVRICQLYLESGFQTFQGASPQFIHRFHQQTPSSVVGSTIHWALKLALPDTITSTKDIRQNVFNLLDPMAGSCDAIDTIHLQCKLLTTNYFWVENLYFDTHTELL